MNRPIGFDLADLTADDRRALRNQRAVHGHIERFNATIVPTARELKRRRSHRTRDALVTAAQVAGGALACIGFVAYVAVFLGV